MFRRLRYSLSARLLLLFLLVGVLISVLLSVTFGFAMRHYFQRVVRPHVELYLDYVQQDIGVPPDIDKAAALARRVPVSIVIRGPDINWSSVPTNEDFHSLDFKKHFNRRGTRTAVADDEDRTVLRTQAGQHTVYYIVRQREPRGRGHFVSLLTISVILLILYCTYRGIRWLFKPVQDIQRGVGRIGGGELDYRIPIRRRDELGELTASINTMADDIEKMLEAKRQLLLAISHELRSPITRARVNSALLSEGATKTAIEADLREMETLLQELLETERLSTRHNVLNRQPVAVDELVEEVISEHFAGQAVALELAADDTYLLLDAARLKLLIKNLLANALRYSPVGQAPSLLTRLDARSLLIQVSDHGPGIAAEHLAHITEPFYRVDPARQRQTGGYGLGLYLCRVIAQAHGGTLEVHSDVGQGTTIEVTIPLPPKTTDDP